jgi:regulator of protease activity HflC (stomatin/prohibitin superfamily)
VSELLFPIAAAAIVACLSSLRVLREYERAVVFRLGRLVRPKGPGLIFLVPLGIERMVKVPLRIVTMDIPPQDVITRDNISVKVNAVVYFRVRDAVKAVIEIQDYLFATSQLAQTTLRAVIGQVELDQLLAEREQINQIVRKILDEGTEQWGIEVINVETKDIDLPQEMKRAIAKQAEAERERRAKIISAEGELQASAKLTEAARIMSQYPAAIQLRYLQTVSEIATEKNSTTLFPIPIDLFRPFMEKLTGGGGSSAASNTPIAGSDAPIPGSEEPAPLMIGGENSATRQFAHHPLPKSLGMKLDPQPVKEEGKPGTP